MLKRTSTGPAAGTRPTAGPRREVRRSHLPATPVGQAPRRRRNGGFPSAPSRSPAAFMCASGRRINRIVEVLATREDAKGHRPGRSTSGGRSAWRRRPWLFLRAHCRRRRRLSLCFPTWTATDGFSPIRPALQPDGPEGGRSDRPGVRLDRPGTGRASPSDGQVIYEMHIGAFIPAGTWRAAIAELPALAALGVTILEVMPIGDFPGARLGLRRRRPVRADLPWEHADDARLRQRRARARPRRHPRRRLQPPGTDRQCPPGLRRRLLHRRLRDRLGQAAELRPARLRGARTFVISNARYWIDEFHFDRAAHRRHPEHLRLRRQPRAHPRRGHPRRARGHGGRRVVIIAENEPQEFACCARRRTAASVWTPCGTTISITPPRSR